jgi:tetratricopeptide (TPR) repeat protein
MLAQQIKSTETFKITDTLCSAKAKYRISDYQGAIIEYTLVIESSPHVAAAFSGRGDAYSKVGEVEKAMADYDRSTQLDPTAIVNYYRRGNLYYSIKNYVQALAEYSHAIELRPDFALAHIGRGHTNRELYGEQEGMSDWKLAAKLFQEQGNSDQYTYVKNLIDLSTSIDSLSGILE